MTWPQAQPSGPPSSGVPVTIQASYPPIAFMMALFKPKLELPNGQQVPLNWGPTQITMPPGVHPIRIFVPYLFDICQGRGHVDTQHGQPVTVYYAAPYFAYASAAVGTEPQKHPALGIYLAMFIPLLVVLLLLILCMCGGVISSAVSR